MAQITKLTASLAKIGAQVTGPYISKVISDRRSVQGNGTGPGTPAPNSYTLGDLPNALRSVATVVQLGAAFSEDDPVVSAFSGAPLSIGVDGYPSLATASDERLSRVFGLLPSSAQSAPQFSDFLSVSYNIRGYNVDRHPPFAVMSGVMYLGNNGFSHVTEDGSPLLDGRIYYLSTVPGKITPTPPSAPGTYVTPIGFAFDSSVLLVFIGAPNVAGGGSGGNTVENLEVDAVSAPLSPSINVSFVTVADEFEDIQLTLANGTTDGFMKTVRTGPGTSWEIVPASFADGTSVSISDEGTATFLWSEGSGSWGLVSTFDGTVNP